MDVLLRWARRGPATHHDHLPKQKQDLLDGEVGGQATAELGDHGEEQKGKGFLIMHRVAWGVRRGIQRAHVRTP